MEHPLSVLSQTRVAHQTASERDTGSTAYLLKGFFIAGCADCAMPCLTLCAELEPSAAYIECVVRGSCWKDANACGDAGPVGKKLAMGDDGGEE